MHPLSAVLIPFANAFGAAGLEIAYVRKK